MSAISIIIPVYNCEKYISKTIYSVLQQTYHNYKCIIVDDGSTDNTYKIITKIVDGDKRFKIIQQKNLGECAARNTGISLVSTPYITVLDSDDIWHPNFLQYMLDVLQKNGIDFAWCHFAMFYDGTNIRKRQPWLIFIKQEIFGGICCSIVNSVWGLGQHGQIKCVLPDLLIPRCAWLETGISLYGCWH